jgi:hypothetical protein
MLVAVADCPRHKALGEERCGVVYEDLLALDSFFAPVPPIGDRC